MKQIVLPDQCKTILPGQANIRRGIIAKGKNGDFAGFVWIDMDGVYYFFNSISGHDSVGYMSLTRVMAEFPTLDFFQLD